MINLLFHSVRESSDNVFNVGNAVTVNYNGEVQMSVFINLSVTDQIKLYRPNQELNLLLTVFSLKKYIMYRQKYWKSKLVYIVTSGTINRSRHRFFQQHAVYG